VDGYIAELCREPSHHAVHHHLFINVRVEAPPYGASNFEHLVSSVPMQGDL
jgi:hypothetical protein